VNTYQYTKNPIQWVDFFGLAASCPVCPVHHICTNKNDISTARGGPWSPRFQKIFDKAGYDMDDAINKIGIPGHAGPHPEAYHSEVLGRLESAVKGKSGEAYKKAFEDEMGNLKRDVSDPNHHLNKLLCKR
jgi:hypothetical protein